MEPIRTHCINELKTSNLDLVSLLKKAHKITLEEASLKRKYYKQRNYMAEVMYGNIIGLLYDNYKEKMHIDEYGVHYLKVGKDVRVFIKKLNKNYLPSNQVTEIVKKRRGQELGLNDDKIHTLYAGYLLKDNIWTKELEGCFISYINKYYPKKSEWIYDLINLSVNNFINTEKEEIENDELLVKVVKETREAK